MPTVPSNPVASRDFLKTEPLGPLMTRLALPAIASQLVNLLYNIVDRMFIGHIPGVGADALTGVGVCLPVIVFISSFAAFAGSGGAPLASMALGSGDRERAQEVVRTVTTLLFGFGVLLVAATYALLPVLLPLFGASAATLPYASTYLSIYAAGTFFVMAYLGLTPLLLAQGDSRLTLVAVSSGAVLNIGLDALLIYGCGWGIAGAAIASVASQGVSAALTIAFLRRRSSALVFRFCLVRPKGRLVGRILALGAAPFFMQATESLVLIALNSNLQAYGGDLYVGALTVMQSAMSLISAPVSGFTQGCQTIVSFNYGARLLERSHQAARLIIRSAFVITLACALLVMVFPTPIARLFTNDEGLIQLVGQAAPLFFAGFTLFGAQMGIQPVFVALGQSVCAISVAAVRKVVFLVPLAYIFPHFWGAWGVYAAEPVSDLMSVTFCCVLYLLRAPKLWGGRGGEGRREDPKRPK